MNSEGANKRKKGVKQSLYKYEIIKTARVKGDEYTNWKENVVPARKQGENCK